MKVPLQHDPRGNQKLRTRSAIVDAAIVLLEKGQRPTVPQAAAAAKVSRATAYRYFPTQETLLIEAAAIRPVNAIETLLANQTCNEPQANFLEFQTALNTLLLREEGVMRMALRAYLDAWFNVDHDVNHQPYVREGRRTRWITKTLKPVLDDLSQENARRLQAALALTMGIEPLVIMKDVCRLDNEQAQEVLEWVALTLLSATVSESTT